MYETESLCCIPETNIIHQPYFSKKKNNKLK